VGGETDKISPTIQRRGKAYIAPEAFDSLGKTIEVILREDRQNEMLAH